ncbi:MAG TPA: hypothetical protein VK338_03360, partial [Candidatus Nitrosocosmicus sp.]|nr:hypothetical protein [Candidatus Nitrosocosmicus sp.]
MALNRENTELLSKEPIFISPNEFGRSSGLAVQLGRHIESSRRIYSRVQTYRDIIQNRLDTIPEEPSI